MKTLYQLLIMFCVLLLTAHLGYKIYGLSYPQNPETNRLLHYLSILPLTLLIYDLWVNPFRNKDGQDKK